MRTTDLNEKKSSSDNCNISFGRTKHCVVRNTVGEVPPHPTPSKKRESSTDITKVALKHLWKLFGQSKQVLESHERKKVMGSELLFGDRLP